MVNDDLTSMDGGNDFDDEDSYIDAAVGAVKETGGVVGAGSSTFPSSFSFSSSSHCASCRSSFCNAERMEARRL